MNYLAHVYLARQSDAAMVGALLGDFVKVGIAGKFGDEIEREVRIHRRVDAFTDSHPVTQEARRLFSADTRRFSGISLDVFYDHVLANSWDRYCATPLPEFVQRFYAALLLHENILPENLNIIAQRMVDQDWLGSYRDFESVKIAVNRISGRLSRNGDLLRKSLVDLDEHYERLSDGFHVFFPELIRFVDDERARFRG